MATVNYYQTDSDFTLIFRFLILQTILSSITYTFRFSFHPHERCVNSLKELTKLKAMFHSFKLCSQLE